MIYFKNTDSLILNGVTCGTTKANYFDPLFPIFDGHSRMFLDKAGQIPLACDIPPILFLKYPSDDELRGNTPVLKL
jgi:hypothetical protein